MKQKIIFAVGAVVLVAFVVYRIINARQFSIERVLRGRPSNEEFVFDYVGHLKDIEKFREKELRYTRDQYGVEFVVVIVPTLSGRDIHQVAADIFTRWAIGLDEGGRGVLLFFSDEDKMFRIEVGHALEHVFTDNFCGEIERRQIDRYFRQKNVAGGISATLTEFLIRFKKQNGRFVGLSLQTYLSGGAGIQEEVPVGSRINKKVLTEKERNRYGAQPTPDKAFKVFRDVFKNTIDDYRLGIYTEGTQVYLDCMTKAMPKELGDWMYSQFSNPYEILHDENYAVVIFLDDRYVGPIFMTKSDDGWQIDLVSTTKWVRVILGGEWYVVGNNHPYMFAFTKTRYAAYARDMDFYDSDPFSAVITNFRDSIRKYEARIVQEPYDFDTELQLAFVYMDLHITTKALEVLRSLSKKHPHRGVPYYYMGLILRDDHIDNDEAIACFKRYIERNRTMACGYRQLGLTYHRKATNDMDPDSYDKAVEAYKIYAELSEDKRYAYNRIGFVYLMKRDTSDAIAWFRKTLELYPNNDYARRQIAELTR